MDPELVKSIFSFGVKVAEHVHGIRRTGDDTTTDAMFDTIRSINDGSLTLLPTPEEMIASLPTPPQGVKLNIGPEFYEAMRVSRENERIVARMVADSLPR